MRLLTTLLVCSHFILGSANQALTIEADCNDQNIFNVVDEALRFHNNELLDGNQFVLYRITEANIRPENDGGTHNFVSYEIHEGSCGVKSGKVWQDCDFKTPASERIKCSAHVLINKEEKINEIISQNCSIVKVEDPVIAIHHQGLGSFIPIDRNSEELLPIVQASIQKMNHLGNHPFHFDLENITSASRQVVSGWNYDIYYDVRQTNCSKLAHYSLSSADCKLDANGQRGYCKSRVFVIPTGEIKDINAQCSSEKGFCLTCPNEVDRDDPELKNLLRQVMDEYNSDSNHTNLYKITNIIKATAKGSVEKMYEVDFEIFETNCSKTDFAILGDECETALLGEPLSCHAKINTTDTTIRVHRSPTCSEIQRQMASRGIYKGLSPLRMVPIRERSLKRLTRGAERSKGHGHGNGHHGHNHKEQKHGKKDKKDKNGKKKKNHRNEDSSEESKEDIFKPTVSVVQPAPETTTQIKKVLGTSQHSQSLSEVPVEPTTKAILQKPSPATLFPHIPDVSNDQGPFPNIHDTILSDLPVPPATAAPKCPGKPWKSIRSQPTLPTINLLDLAWAIGDVASPGAGDKKTIEPASPPNGQSFTDEDLLN